MVWTNAFLGSVFGGGGDETLHGRVRWKRNPRNEVVESRIDWNVPNNESTGNGREERFLIYDLN